MQHELLLHTILFCTRAHVLTAPFSHWLFYPGGYYRRPVQNKAEALHLSFPVFGMGFSLRKFDISSPIYFDISYLQTVKRQYRLCSQTDLGVSSISFISSYLISLTVFFLFACLNSSTKWEHRYLTGRTIVGIRGGSCAWPTA